MLDLTLRAGAVVAISAVILIGYLYLAQRGMIYFPGTSSGGVEPPPPGVEQIELRTADGLGLAAWFVPAAGGRDGPGPAVLICNGNAGNRSHRLPLAVALAERGLHVLLFDYRGYAGNPGSPSESGLRADARAAAEALAARPEVDPRRIAYFGESLGSAVAGGLAIELPPAVVILRSPIPSILEMGRHHYPFLPIVEALLWDRYPLSSQLSGLSVPLLVLVGERDEIVPPELSRHVFDAAAGPKRYVELPASGHNDRELLDGERLLNAVEGFLAEWLR